MTASTGGQTKRAEDAFAEFNIGTNGSMAFNMTLFRGRHQPASARETVESEAETE